MAFAPHTPDLVSSSGIGIGINQSAAAAVQLGSASTRGHTHA